MNRNVFRLISIQHNEKIACAEIFMTQNSFYISSTQSFKSVALTISKFFILFIYFFHLIHPLIGYNIPRRNVKNVWTVSTRLKKLRVRWTTVVRQNEIIKFHMRWNHNNNIMSNIDCGLRVWRVWDFYNEGTGIIWSQLLRFKRFIVHDICVCTGDELIVIVVKIE